MRYRNTSIGIDLGPREAFTIGGIKYPRNWMELSTEVQRASIGFESYEPSVSEPTPYVFAPADWPLSPRQFRDMLIDIGMSIEAVDAALEASGMTGSTLAKARNALHYSSVYRWDDPLMQAMAAQLGAHPDDLKSAWEASSDYARI